MNEDVSPIKKGWFRIAMFDFLNAGKPSANHRLFTGQGSSSCGLCPLSFWNFTLLKGAGWEVTPQNGGGWGSGNEPPKSPLTIQV